MLLMALSVTTKDGGRMDEEPPLSREATLAHDEAYPKDKKEENERDIVELSVRPFQWEKKL